IPRRYVLRTLGSKSSTMAKKRCIETIAKSPRTLHVHMAKDNAVIGLSGPLWRQYRVRIYFNDQGYFIHSTLIHHKFTSPLHFGYSSRQTDRVVTALRSIDPNT
ncbi:MAG: hypothetical protein KF797_10610, partial [Flavobacteriales bacterium]|nr:hypothetical protein [Flavobacteriales bacterium]